MARKGGGSVRQTGTKVSAKKLGVRQVGNSSTVNRSGMFTGKGSSKVGQTK